MKRRKPRTQPDVPSKEAGPFFSKVGAQPDVQAKDDGFFQPKLTIGLPGDRYEQEADQMAGAVVNHSRSNASEGAVRKKARVQRMDEEEPQAKLQRQEEEEAQAKLQRQEEEEQAQPKLQMQEEEEAQAKLQMQEEEEPQAKLQMQEEEEAQAKLQRQEEEEAAQPKIQRQAQKKPARAQLAQRLAENKGGGNPLPPKVRQQMEGAFETDFSGVRVHTDQEAVQMNQGLNAQAFTHGNDVYFNKGKFSPESGSGKHLLAHELTHVVQQRKK